jgi:alkanesulfonate monooxygenase SsuD/methylene tetrahydromethanopterin reductase-like flavin-dependent oxidoreductase (luciferase family)
MQGANDVQFGWVASAAGAPGTTDDQMFEDMLEDAELNHSLGYRTAWMIEHHFSDYFPTPDPLQMLTYLSAKFPDISLGTCVIVTPWYNPLRLAEQIAMLSVLCKQRLHLGLGRGTAKFEYDAFGINMEEARGRFQEMWDILQVAMTGERFTHEGEFYHLDKEVRIRPTPAADRVNFYGAIGTPQTAGIMGKLGLPPMCTSIGDYERQVETLTNWRAAAEEAGHPTEGVVFPLMINCIVADTDEDAVEEAKIFMPRYMKAQVDHYTVHTTDWANTKGYEAWQRMFDGIVSRQDPENIPPWTEWQLIGSPETVRRKTQMFIDAGFNHLIMQFTTPGVPAADRRRWATRFAREVAPHFSGAFRPQADTIAAAV